jgi:chalcone isomerase-like protein
LVEWPAARLRRLGAKGQLPALKERIEELKGLMADMKSGQRLTFVAKPGAGVEVNVNGTVKGTIEGDDFSKALLSIWAGRRAAKPGPENRTAWRRLRLRVAAGADGVNGKDITAKEDSIMKTTTQTVETHADLGNLQERMNKADTRENEGRVMSEEEFV